MVGKGVARRAGLVLLAGLLAPAAGRAEPCAEACAAPSGPIPVSVCPGRICPAVNYSRCAYWFPLAYTWIAKHRGFSVSVYPPVSGPVAYVPCQWTVNRCYPPGESASAGAKPESQGSSDATPSPETLPAPATPPAATPPRTPQ